MTTPPVVWDGVLRRLSAELPEFALEAWIQPLRVREADDQLVLLAPSEFHRRRVESRFLALISRIAGEEAQRPLAVQIEVAPAGCAARGSSLPGPAPQPPAPPASAVRRTAAAVPAARPPAALVPAVRPPAPAARLPGRVARTSRTVPSQPELPYTFDTFVVGPANALAREASVALARGGQSGLSPLFLVGPAGTGKSHLARALAAEVRRSRNLRSVYASAESFTNALSASIRSRETRGFKRRFRDECDLLVIEDVQFLQGKAATQLELFHTLEHLVLVGRSVVLTGDRLPREIPDLDRRLGSEMTRGLVARLEPPDAQLRRQILRSKAARGGVRIPEPCLDRLVEAVEGSVRDLEGVLRQLVASAALLKRNIDLALTEEALRKVLPEPTGPEALGVSEVIDCVASFCGLTPRDLGSRSRRQDVLVPRQLAMYLCRRFTDATLTEIGRALGRDHPAVRNAIDKVERAILERAPLRYQVEALVARLEKRRSG